MNARAGTHPLGRCVVLVLCAWLLPACGGGEPREDQISADARLERINRSARAAFDMGQYAEAVSLYRRALEVAYERAEPGAVADAEYNVAVALLRLNRIEEARRSVVRAKAELERSGAAPPADLRLLEATLLFRAGRHREADALARRLLAQSPGSDAARRAHFLRGLIAAEEGATERLRRSIEALEGTGDARLAADRRELAGRLALLEDRLSTALDAFDQAARLRRETGDYSGMVRALALAGETHERTGDGSRAASAYLQAGRSLLQQGATGRARTLLTRALELAEAAHDTETAREARHHLTRLRSDEAPPDD